MNACKYLAHCRDDLEAIWIIRVNHISAVLESFRCQANIRFGREQDRNLDEFEAISGKSLNSWGKGVTTARQLPHNE